MHIKSDLAMLHWKQSFRDDFPEVNCCEVELSKNDRKTKQKMVFEKSKKTNKVLYFHNLETCAAVGMLHFQESSPNVGRSCFFAFCWLLAHGCILAFVLYFIMHFRETSVGVVPFERRFCKGVRSLALMAVACLFLMECCCGSEMAHMCI